MLWKKLWSKTKIRTNCLNKWQERCSTLTLSQVPLHPPIESVPRPFPSPDVLLIQSQIATTTVVTYLPPHCRRKDYFNDSEGDVEVCQRTGGLCFSLS